MGKKQNPKWPNHPFINVFYSDPWCNTNGVEIEGVNPKWVQKNSDSRSGTSFEGGAYLEAIFSSASLQLPSLPSHPWTTTLHMLWTQQIFQLLKEIENLTKMKSLFGRFKGDLSMTWKSQPSIAWLRRRIELRTISQREQARRLKTCCCCCSRLG